MLHVRFQTRFGRYIKMQSISILPHNLHTIEFAGLDCLKYYEFVPSIIDNSIMAVGDSAAVKD